jgi:hypothetical protein
MNPVSSHNLRSFNFGEPVTESGDARRFWAKVERTDGCWLWTASRSGGRRGKCYGQFTTTVAPGRQKHWGAHVFAYVLANGPVPDGLEVMHACNNGLCVRPNHLSAGTTLQNVQDAARDGLYHVPRPGRQKVTDEQIEAMTDLRRGGMTLEAIAQRFNVSESYVSFIVRGLRRQYRQRVAQRVAS